VPETARSLVHVDERFDIASFDRPARFVVTTTYSGLSADSERRYFSETTPEQIAKYYVSYYATAYPGISSAAPPELEDDRISNVATVTETYDVPNLWTDENETRKIKAEFYPKPISDYAVRPQTQIRTMPLRVSYPTHVWLTTTVNLPELWSVKPADKLIESHAFRAKAGIAGAGKVVTMTYEWESLSNHVPAEKVAKHVEELNRYRDMLGYSLTYTKPDPQGATVATPNAKPAFLLNWKLTFLALTVFAGAGYAGTSAWRQPAAPPLVTPLDPSAPAGLGGWLLLIGFGVTVRPFALLVQFYTSLRHTFDQNFWETITTPGTAAYQRVLAPLIVVETIGNTLLLAGSVLMVALFYRRKQAFPRVFIIVMLFNVALLALDSWGASLVVKAPTASNSKDFVALFQAIAQAAVWIPYMRLSTRVKATFVR
jgi:hypothetical protein